MLHFIIIYFIAFRVSSLTEVCQSSQDMAHGSRIVSWSHVTGSVDPEHGQVAARLLVAFQYTIHADGIARRIQVLVSPGPVELVYPVDSARCGTDQIQTARKYAHFKRCLVQQLVYCIQIRAFTLHV